MQFLLKYNCFRKNIFCWKVKYLDRFYICISESTISHSGCRYRCRVFNSNTSADCSLFVCVCVQMFKGFDKAKDIQYVYTPVFSSLCGVKLDSNNKAGYLLSGEAQSGTQVHGGCPTACIMRSDIIGPQGKQIKFFFFFSTQIKRIWFGWLKNFSLYASEMLLYSTLPYGW